MAKRKLLETIVVRWEECQNDDDYLAVFEDEYHAAEQRASAGMQAAAAQYLERYKRPLLAEEMARHLAYQIRSLTRADGTNALEREKAKAELSGLRYAHRCDPYSPTYNTTCCRAGERSAELEREAGGVIHDSPSL